MLTVNEVRAVITTSLSDSDLADVITREEAWLARRIGPLDGERVETFVTYSGDEVLELGRPAVDIDITDDFGDRLDDIDMRGWSDVVITSGAWSGSVEVTYTPTDADEVRRAALTLVRLALAESAYSGETAQGYSATTDLTQQRQMRWSAWQGIRRPRVPGTATIGSPVSTTGRTGDRLRSVSVVASGS